MSRSNAKNVLGTDLESCSLDPLTGFYRNGCCDTGDEDAGIHTICVEVSAKFLAFSKEQGIDLSTPRPEFEFPGLRAGDQWCLCAERWQEAFEAGAAPRVVLRASHIKTLRTCSIHDLENLAVQ